MAFRNILAKIFLLILFISQCPLTAIAQSDSVLLAKYNDLIARTRINGTDSAAHYAEVGLLYFTSKNFIPGQAEMVNSLAMADIEQGRYEQAKIRAIYAISLYRQLHDLRHVVVLQNLIGSIEASRRKVDMAEEYYSLALELHDTIPNDYAGLMLTYMNMGKLAQQNKDTAEALKYFSQAEAVSNRIPICDTTIALYNYIAQLHITRGDEEKAQWYMQKSIRLSDNTQMDYSHAQSLFHMGVFYSERGDASQALTCWNKALGLAIQHNLYALQVNILLNVAEIVLPQYANDYLDQAMNVCNKMHNPMTRARLYGEMAMMYERQGKYMNALYAAKKQNKIIDSLDEINRDKEYKSKGMVYQLTKSNNRVKQLELLSRMNAIQSTTISVISISLILALGVTIFMYNRTNKLNSKLKKHERELDELNTMKNKLFSIIGHDLRAPLGKIYTVLDMYDDDVFTEEEKREILMNLKEHTKATSETLDKLLFWGQSLLKGITLQQITFESKMFITQNVELKRTAATDKNITVVDNTPDHLILHTDKTHFDFVLRNLLANAIKFTRQNGRIEINSDEQLRLGYVVFAVKDNGVGIAPDDVKQIFTPFNSKDGTANEKGTGMGLMLSKEFMAKNGGDLWVESTLGEGTTFYFSVKKAD